MIYELKQPQKAAKLFAGWQESLIWSCLQGVMGKLYVDSLEEPACVMAYLGDFCFLAGKPDKELILCGVKKTGRKFLIIVPQNEDWAGLVEQCCGERAKRVTRYAIKKERDIFSREKLQTIIDSLPAGYTLKMMDEMLFWHCRKTEWCKDWTAQYKDYAEYQKYGMGAVILEGEEPVSGASSYSGYIGGIEIEIDTKEEYRRKGLAGVCGAKLILECLKRGLYPSWDAQNKWSVALAEKLGYHFSHEYPAYEVTPDTNKQEFSERFLFRDIKPEETEEAIDIEQICFPPHEACSPGAMRERISRAPELFLVAVDKGTGRIAGFFNGVATEEEAFRDEFFTDISLHRPKGKNVMLLGLDVLPEYRGQGLAGEIVKRYVGRQQEAGRSCLVLTCLEEKVQMYKKMGFCDCGIANSTWGNEQWHEMRYEIKQATDTEIR